MGAGEEIEVFAALVFITMALLAGVVVVDAAV
jgi:hypothetical protein